MGLCRTAFVVIGAIAWSALLSPLVSAQELEPNNACSAAQDGGTVVPPAFTTGSIDAIDAPFGTDVDFYRFSAAPGLALSVTSSFSERVGLFNEACVLQTASDFSVENRIDFSVPESGTF